MAKKSRSATGVSRVRTKAGRVKPPAADNPGAVAERPAANSVPPPPVPEEQSAPADEAVRLQTGSVAVNLGETGKVQAKEEKLDLTLGDAAMQWTYIVRNRRRWSTLPDLKRQQAQDAAALLKGFGVKASDLQSFADAQMVEVCVPRTEDEARNWPARVLPWEFVIASATQEWRGDNALTVIRYMDYRDEPRPRATANKCVLFVSSEPGPLQGLYQFDTEREVVQDNLADARDKNNWKELHNPTEEKLVNALREWQPAIVHFAGFDTHQALSMVAQIEKDEGRPFDKSELWDSDPAQGGDLKVKDGYVLKGTLTMLNAVGAEKLAKILRNENKDGIPQPPRLVVFNFYNSAARIASLALSHGVESAIGFQDRFDDDLAERFLAFLYAQLDWSDWNTAIAFRSAFERVRSQPQHQQGTGVVHWSTVPLLTDRASPEVVREKIERTDQKIREEAEALQPGDVAPNDVEKFIKVTVKPFDDINYSMLQNKRELFNKFTLAPISRTGGHGKPAHRTICGVSVAVTLDVGDGTATYEQTLDVEYPFRDLSSDIHLPLTSTLTRAVHESINTSMLVEVVWGTHVLYSDSLRVRLTPVDQWRDSDSDRRWLPSFVFPRDRAVSELVDKAQRYVRVLRDDPASGFDGYQSINATPSMLTKKVDTEEVDLQVQAIWSAIVHEMGLTYINPPPGYSSSLDSQRLRTPSMVRDYHSGTCIDLALLFAACLELIDIYPVIFLLQGHAFPGYWRWDAHHEEFVQTKFDQIRQIMPKKPRAIESAEVEDDTWFFKQDTRREIMQYVYEGKLVPLETVRLTEHCGFWEAVEAGLDNFRDPQEFEAMVDIKLARDLLVTPLPILGEQT